MDKREIVSCTTKDIENPMPEDAKFVRDKALSDAGLHRRAGTAGAAVILVLGHDDNDTLAAALAAASIEARPPTSTPGGIEELVVWPEAFAKGTAFGFNKIALGHHRDDMLQTLFMNMFFGSRLKGMPPKLVSDDGRHTVIRPLAYVAERDLATWADHRQFPIIPCTLCGSQDNLQRVQVKAMLREWERRYPGRSDNMLRAMGRHPNRPGHIHMKVSAPGHKELVTHLFVKDSPFLDSDAVFGVRESLIIQYTTHPAGPAPEGRTMATPWHQASYDFRLAPAA